MNVGIPEIMIIGVIVLLLGTPALLAIIFLALRRAAGSASPIPSTAAPAPSPPPAGAPMLRAAGHIRADGSLAVAGGGLQSRRIEQGVYQLTLDGFDPAQGLLMHATPLAGQPGEAPALAEVLAGEVRARYLAAGAAETALLVWLRTPDQTLVDRDWMVQITAVA